MKELSVTYKVILISSILTIISYQVLSRLRTLFCRWILSQHFWINEDGLKSDSKRVWWYMFWVRIFTAFFETRQPYTKLISRPNTNNKISVASDKAVSQPTQQAAGCEEESIRAIEQLPHLTIEQKKTMLKMVTEATKVTQNLAPARDGHSQMTAKELVADLLKDVEHENEQASGNGNRKILYSYQELLPRLPLPLLADTLGKLKRSLVPLVQYNPGLLPVDCIKRLEEFERWEGPLLQTMLLVRSQFTDNYVSDWWEKYVYLKNRKPLAINSNYYILDMSHYIPTHKPSARAATIIHQILKFRQQIMNETMKPLKVRDTIPVCMDQYRRLFSTCRIPGNQSDTLKHFLANESKHIVLKINHCQYYKIFVERPDLQNIRPYEPYPAHLYQAAIEEIMADISIYDNLDTQENSFAYYLNDLTQIGRDDWADIRGRNFSCGVNRASLNDIESAIFMVTILNDNVIPEELISPSQIEDHQLSAISFSDQGHYMLTGYPPFTPNAIDSTTTCAIWFDKSINLIVFPTGKIGLNCEHSYGDATITAHMHEYVLSNEVRQGSYTEDGDCIGYQQYKTNFSRQNNLQSNKCEPITSYDNVSQLHQCNLSPETININHLDNNNFYDNANGELVLENETDLLSRKKLIKYEKLQWDLSDPTLRNNLKLAHSLALKNSQNIDECVKEFNGFGKGFMKKNGLSPDAFVQIAIQLAYFRSKLQQLQQKGISIGVGDIDKYGLLTATYEASSTRLFARGRTETVRSLTVEMANFIRAFHQYFTESGKYAILPESYVKNPLPKFSSEFKNYNSSDIRNNNQDLPHCNTLKNTNTIANCGPLIQSLRDAAIRHQQQYREAITGKGCDRHLFALYVMSKHIGKGNKILEEILSIPWEISSSQSPQQQITTNVNFDSPLLADKLSPGGGFGPVTPQGIGIAYMFPCSYKLFFHVTKFWDPMLASQNGSSILTSTHLPEFHEREKSSKPKALDTNILPTPILEDSCLKNSSPSNNYLTCSASYFMDQLFDALNILKDILEQCQDKN